MYFNALPYRVIDGQIVYADDLNDPFTALQIALSLLVNDIRAGSNLLSAPDTGSNNAYALALDPAVSAYATGQLVLLTPATINTGPATLSLNGLTPQVITRFGLQALQPGDLDPQMSYLLRYDGTRFQVISAVPGTDLTGAPIAAYLNTATYNFPDVVAAIDGYGYRCIGFNVTGVNPVTDDGTTWTRLTTPMATANETAVGLSSTTAVTPAGLRSMVASEAEAIAGTEQHKTTSPATAHAIVRNIAIPALPAGVKLTGNIYGLDFAKTGNNQLTVNPGACIDSTGSVALSLAAAATVVVPATASTIYQVMLVRRISDGGCEVRCYTSEAEVESDVQVDRWRWLGYVRTNTDSIIIDFTMNGDLLLFWQASKWIVASNIGTSRTTINHATRMPVDRVREILYGTGYVDGSQRGLYIEDSSGNLILNVSNTATGSGDTNAAAWGQATTPPYIPFNPDYLFRGSVAGVDVLVHGLRLKR
jgi:hypothetical protein